MTPTTRWPVVVGYALASSANQMLWLTYAPVTTVAAEHYGVSESAIGWLAEIFPLLYVVLALPAGDLLDRWFRPSLLFGAWLTAAGAVLRLGGGYDAALAGQLLIAVAQPFVLNALTKVVSGYVEPRRRPAGIAVGSASIFSGIVLALALGAVLGQASDIPLLLAISAAYAVAAAAALSVTLRHAPTYVPELGAAGLARLKRVWADPAIRAVTGLALLGFGVFVAVTTWLQALLEPAGIGSTASGVLLLELVLVGIVGSALLPAVIVRRDGTRRFLRAAVLSGAVGLLALALWPRMGVAVVVVAVLGVALLTALPLLLEIVERRAGAAGATGAALLWMAGNLGGLIVAVAVQGLLDHPGLAFGVMALALLAGLPLLRPNGRMAL